MLEGYLTTKEVADKLKVSVGRVKQFVAEKRLPAIKVGHTNLIKETDLKLVEDRQTGRPTSQNPSKATLSKRMQREREQVRDK